MLLQASTSWLNALIAYATAQDAAVPGNAASPTTNNLRLMNALARDSNRPQVDNGYIANDTTIAALINSGSKVITPPANYVGTFWLAIPPSWVRALAGASASSMPSEELQLSVQCGADFQGAWGAAFQAIGFTTYTPSVSGPWPVIAG